MSLTYDFAAGSRDVLTVFVADRVLDAQTGEITETPIDLTGKMVELHYQIDGGATVVATFDVRIPQTGTDRGRADHEWQAGELTEGTLTGQVVVTGVDGLPHRQPTQITLEIGPAI